MVSCVWWKDKKWVTLSKSTQTPLNGRFHFSKFELVRQRVQSDERRQTGLC